MNQDTSPRNEEQDKDEQFLRVQQHLRKDVFLPCRQLPEHLDEPQNVCTHEIKGLRKYPCFRFMVSFDDRWPEEKKSVQASLGKIFKELEQLDTGKQLLKNVMQEYKKTKKPLRIHFYAGNVGYHHLSRTGGAGAIRASQPLNDLLTESEKEGEKSDIDVVVERKNPPYTAQILFHELLHHLQHTQIYKSVLKKEDASVDVQELLLLAYCSELFAHVHTYTDTYKRYGVSDLNLMNYLAVLQQNNTPLSDTQLAEKTGLSLIKSFVDQVPVSEVSEKLPCMNPNYIYDPELLEYLQAEKDGTEELFGYFHSVMFYLGRCDIPLEKITCDGKEVRQVFNQFLKLHFPNSCADARDFKVEKKASGLMEKFPEYAEEYLKLKPPVREIARLIEILVKTNPEKYGFLLERRDVLRKQKQQAQQLQNHPKPVVLTFQNNENKKDKSKNNR